MVCTKCSIMDDVEDRLHAFNLLFNGVLDQHTPIKTIKVRGRPKLLFFFRNVSSAIT